MSRLNIKQLGVSGANNSASLVYNGTSLVFSNSSTGALLLPSGTTGQQPTPANGMIRYNSTNNKFEAYENGAWTNIISSVTGAARYRFTVQLNGTAVATAGSPVTNLPSGWTSATTASSVTVTTNLGIPPASVIFFGQTVNTSSTTRTTRTPTGTVNVLTFDSATPNTLTIGSITNTSVGAVSGGIFDVVMVF